MRRRAIGFCLCSLLISALGCPGGDGIPTPTESQTPTESLTPEPTPIEDPVDALILLDDTELPTLIDDGAEDWSSLKRAVRYSLRWYGAHKSTREFTFGPRTATALELRHSLGRLLSFLEGNPTAEELDAWIKTEFDVLEAEGSHHGDMMFTGYFEPTIEASLTRKKGYEVPIYRRPRDMVYVDLGRFDEKFEGEKIAGRISGNRLEPYWNRKEIWTKRTLARKGLEMAWAKDPVDVFFLEVQGSGSLELPDGRLVRIGYAGSNGRPYESIGRLLIEEGKVPAEKMSMQAIREYLDNHPEDVAHVLHHNDSFVFFKFIDGEPRGNLGQPVTALRSIATDSRLMPKGALAFIDTLAPERHDDGTVGTNGGIRRFVLNQDTGGAIKGTGRADIFWGRGAQAAESAGLMQHPGRLYFLVPKSSGE